MARAAAREPHPRTSASRARSVSQSFLGLEAALRIAGAPTMSLLRPHRRTRARHSHAPASCGSRLCDSPQRDHRGMPRARPELMPPDIDQGAPAAATTPRRAAALDQREVVEPAQPCRSAISAPS